ncbi:hypothetical protein GCM10022277_04920 [Litoribacillus peritrichatus]|uniref:Uncharacterized protein n=1 Tax=Litoribacillus peritrichatus TaxID=718191 RepID=A0ABP7M241_9GAMM
MEYLRKIDSWKNRHEKLILKDGDKVFYISAKAATSKASQEGKDLWLCSEGGNVFYILREKDS